MGVDRAEQVRMLTEMPSGQVEKTGAGLLRRGEWEPREHLFPRQLLP